MKNKKIPFIIIITLIIFLIIISVILTSGNDNKEKTNNKSKKCYDIEQKIKKEETFALFITNDLSLEDESNEVVNKYLYNYKDKNIYTIQKNDIEDVCIKKMIINLGIYEILKNEQNNSVLGFEKGQLIVSQYNIVSYDTLENYLDENKIIEKIKIKESINLTEFKNKKKEKEYLLLIITDENKRNYFSKNMRKYFDEYNYNIINRKSDNGKKIDDYIKKEYKNYNKKNEYPRLVLFKENEIKYSDIVIDEKTFETYKNKIKEL